MALGSFAMSTGSLELIFTRNNVSSLPANLLANISSAGTSLANGAANVTPFLRENPIAVINESVFSSTAFVPGYVSMVMIDMSNATTENVRVPSSFVVDNIFWVSFGYASLSGNIAPPTLIISAANTSINMSIVRALGALASASIPDLNSLQINLDLRFNNYTDVSEGAFSNPMLQST